MAFGAERNGIQRNGSGKAEVEGCKVFRVVDPPENRRMKNSWCTCGETTGWGEDGGRIW